MTSRAVAYFAPAKINWTLLVTGRRADGYHNVDTVMQAITLADKLHFSPAATPACSIVCSDRSIPTGADNLIARAWRLMRARFPERVGGLRIRLEKRIPAGAGLGGGSSDAAAALAAINQIYGLRQSRAGLAPLAAELGSDVPFFLYGGAARATGRGEIIQPISSRLRRVSLVVAFPGFPSPTGAAYGALKPRDYFDDKAARTSPSRAAAAALEDGDPIRLGDAVSNTFDPALRRAEPRYGALAAAMEAAGLARPLLSGSGSAMFAWAADRLVAARACGMLKKQGLWAAACSPSRSGVRRAEKQG